MYKLIDLDVLGIRVTALSEILTAAERLGFAGLNITYPCKQPSSKSSTSSVRMRARSAP